MITCLENDYQGLHEISVETKMLESGICMINSEIDMHTVDRLFEQFWYMKKKGLSMNLWINSHGGSVTDGLAIVDLVQSAGDVTALCVGTAYSMAAVIFAVCQKRKMLPHSRLMIHEPSLMTTGGNATSIKETAQEMLSVNKTLCGILSAASGRKQSEIEKIVQKDKFFTADEAVEFGLCDAIAGKEDLWI